jgi:SAM-dependent methyltransferase
VSSSNIKIERKRRDSFFRHFEKLSNGIEKYRKRYQYFWNDIARYCNYFIREDDSVLEIGCANGNLIGQLRGKKKVGIDFSPKMIEKARVQYPEVEFLVQDAEEINLDGQFDTIILSHVTGYFVDIIRVF